MVRVIDTNVQFSLQEYIFLSNQVTTKHYTLECYWHSYSCFLPTLKSLWETMWWNTNFNFLVFSHPWEHPPYALRHQSIKPVLERYSHDLLVPGFKTVGSLLLTRGLSIWASIFKKNITINHLSPWLMRTLIMRVNCWPIQWFTSWKFYHKELFYLVLCIFFKKLRV